MHRNDGLVRARSLTYGLAGISLVGAVAVAGLAHASTEAQRSAHRNQTPATTTPTAPPAHGSDVVPQPTHTGAGKRTPKPTPTPTPKPRHTAAPPQATSGGS